MGLDGMGFAKSVRRGHIAGAPNSEFAVEIDDGPGIPERERERVFAPFYSIETSRNRETGGTGLGLAVARSTVRAHGGDIRGLHERRAARDDLPAGLAPGRLTIRKARRPKWRSRDDRPPQAGAAINSSASCGRVGSRGRRHYDPQPWHWASHHR